MLIVTYSLVTLSIEQQRTRHTLTSLLQHVQSWSQTLHCEDGNSFEMVLNRLAQFDDACHRRNVELYVIPAIRRATQEADALLTELEALSASGASILRGVRDRVQQDLEEGLSKLRELAGSLEFYCHHLLKRLVKEEDELFPIARRVITSEEEWFAIAAQFISHDAELHAYKPCALADYRAAPIHALDEAQHHFAQSRAAKAMQLH